MYKLYATCNKCKKFPTFYKPSLDVVNSPYFKHVYGKNNYVYATLELYEEIRNLTAYYTVKPTTLGNNLNSKKSEYNGVTTTYFCKSII